MHSFNKRKNENNNNLKRKVYVIHAFLSTHYIAFDVYGWDMINSESKEGCELIDFD